VGEPPPEEYLLFKAARYIGCTPWELAKQPIVWMEWALLFESAQNRAHEIMADIAEQRGNVRNGKKQD
jgi:hypothetical protein